ncbi:hypothetical protein [Halotia branconii]|uniref:Uncharacterized protein n=1 Tax=Halotia branconii CENA392 TaxID=1539056 RepID=A0AAJ6NP81_9CYAN|nr:hypothetical protein [Halotia branconii]WGV24023.1 hypothetical protein QI031_19725 [Halotia branconii CENA392]
MTTDPFKVTAEGDVLGVAGANSGTVNITYISSISSETEIHARKLIEGSPYLGLSKFETKDSSKFFGRDTWISELTDYFKQNNVLLLLGASGSGKSSLIRAGLIPALENQPGYEQLVNLTFVPDKDPFKSFHSSLLTKYNQSEAELALAVKEDTLVKVVQSLKRDSQWLIFIDQFEELFTLTPKDKRDSFIKSLIQLIEKSETSVKVVMTMRADFLDKLSPYPKLGKIHDSSSKMLTEMDDIALGLAIAEPAARNGVTFEQGLIEQIISDFRERAGSLPLLQYTLNELWKKDNIQDRVLNTKTYQDLGGVKGALQKQADKIYNKFNEKERKAAENIFIKLIALESKEAVSKRADITALEKDETQKKVLYQLINSRLLVSKREKGKATVEVAHEELLRSWKVLQNLIRDKEEIIVLENRLSADAKQWNELRKKDAQKANSELWNGSKLVRIVELEKEQSIQIIDKEAKEFIKVSEAQAERQKNEKIRTARTIAAGSLVAVVVSSGLGLTAWNQTKQAELNLADSLGSSSLSLLDRRKELDAFVKAIKAGKILQSQHAYNSGVMNALQKALNEGSERNRLEGHNRDVWSVSFSPDGKTLASGSYDKTIKLWNLETGKQIRTLSGHDNFVISVSFSPDGKTLASGSYDKTIKLWNLETGKQIRTLSGHDDWVISVSFSPDGKTLASGSRDKTIKLWNLETGKQIRTLSGHDNFVISVSFSPDGKTLASGSRDKTIKLWNLETGKQIRTLFGHDNFVISVSFSPDGKTLASGSGDKTIKLWNLETGNQIRTLFGHDDFVRSVSFSPDSKTLASGSEDKTIKLWNLETGKQIRTLSGHDDFVISVSFSPDGKTLASGSADNTIKLWNLETGKQIRTLSGHDNWVYSVSFSSDGKTLASGSSDKTIKLWNLETGKQIRTLFGHDNWVYSVSFSPDGKTLASGSEDKTIKLWNLETGKQIRTLSGHDNFVYSVSFSPDGKTLASGSEDKTIKLWNLETGKQIRTLSGHDNFVYSVSFSPDGKTLASGSGDNTIKLWNLDFWNLDLDALMGRSCDWVRGYLQNNPNVSESDRHLCDDIGTQKRI